MTTTEQWVPVEPLADTQEQRRYWTDPKIGDRVRIRLSGECPLKGPTFQRPGGEVQIAGHPAWVNGRTGVVRRCFHSTCVFESAGHGVVVEYLHPENGQPWLGHYAPSELEPA